MIHLPHYDVTRHGPLREQNMRECLCCEGSRQALTAVGSLSTPKISVMKFMFRKTGS